MTTPSPQSKAVDAPEVAAYWAERRRYLDRIRKAPEIRQRFWREVGIYLLRRSLWSFGFFPVFIAFWVPFVMASFNPVVLASDLIPMLQDFVNSNPEVRATTINALVIAWASIGFFFLVFDFVLIPFKSPYEYEADVYMKSWEQLNHGRIPDKT
jgi:dolichyl-phosphate-mannose--protein O-mannosyl transferase